MKTKRNEPENDFPLKMGAPARSALYAIGYTHMAQLTQMKASTLLKLHGFGPKGLSELRKAMAAQSLSFADE